VKTKNILMGISVFFLLACVAGFLSGCGRSGADSAGQDHSAEEALHAAGNNAGEASSGDEHADDSHAHEALRLTGQQMKEYEIEVTAAGPGEIESGIGFPGEVVLNADRMVQVVSRAGGIVREVRKTLGDRVRAGETLAVVESRGLAESLAEYLAGRERRDLAQTVYDREQGLHEKNVSSGQELLDARAALTETRIQFRAAQQKLLALGLTERDIEELAGRQDAHAARYAISAPLAGTIIERHITSGDVLGDDAPVYRIADLATVWVDFQVSRTDLEHLKEGQAVTVRAGEGESAAGKIMYVGKVLDPEKRTALVRILLPNPDGRWRPGLFVTGSTETGRTVVPVRAPVESVQMLEGRPVVFVREEGAFEPREVVTGKKDRTHLEIVSGLEAGEEYVSRGAFRLKADIVTSALGSHAGHGH
jgi:cobalt-zinc-cadmium efflux system membrane fusion protein